MANETITVSVQQTSSSVAYRDHNTRVGIAADDDHIVKDATNLYRVLIDEGDFEEAFNNYFAPYVTTFNDTHKTKIKDNNYYEYIAKKGFKATSSKRREVINEMILYIGDKDTRPSNPTPYMDLLSTFITEELPSLYPNIHITLAAIHADEQYKDKDGNYKPSGIHAHVDYWWVAHAIPNDKLEEAKKIREEIKSSTEYKESENRIQQDMLKKALIDNYNASMMTGPEVQCSRDGALNEMGFCRKPTDVMTRELLAWFITDIRKNTFPSFLASKGYNVDTRDKPMINPYPQGLPIKDYLVQYNPYREHLLKSLYVTAEKTDDEGRLYEQNRIRLTLEEENFKDQKKVFKLEKSHVLQDSLLYVKKVLEKNNFSYQKELQKTSEEMINYLDEQAKKFSDYFIDIFCQFNMAKQFLKDNKNEDEQLNNLLDEYLTNPKATRKLEDSKELRKGINCLKFKYCLAKARYDTYFETLNKITIKDVEKLLKEMKTHKYKTLGFMRENKTILDNTILYPYMREEDKEYLQKIKTKVKELDNKWEESFKKLYYFDEETGLHTDLPLDDPRVKVEHEAFIEECAEQRRKSLEEWLRNERRKARELEEATEEMQRLEIEEEISKREREREKEISKSEKENYSSRRDKENSYDMGR